MLVDSGAQRAALTRQMADKLGLPMDSSQSFRANGVGGSSLPENPRLVGQMRFGPVVWPRYAISTVNGLPPPGPGDPLAPVGIVGADMMSSFDVELDFPARVMRLYSVTGCVGPVVPNRGGYEALITLDAPRNLFIVEVALNGRKIRALLDTGANASSLSRTAARSVGVDAAMLKADPAGSATGIQGVPVVSHRHRFASLIVGSTTFAGPQIAVQDSDFGAFDMLLGMDYLRTRSLWLSYATGQVFIRAGGPRPPPP